MAKTKTVWECSECGNRQTKWSGSCAMCKNWNTYVEETLFEGKFTLPSASSSSNKPVPIKEVVSKGFARLKSSMGEFDRLLGGGAVTGSLSLVGGSPGIGKSTLMLQVSSAYAKQGHTVLYICGEESAEQTSLRAERLGIRDEKLYLFNETSLSVIKSEIDALKPQVVIVDSVQIVYKQEIPSSPGSVLQVKEVAMEFMHIAKGCGITTFLIGHVTKSGEIAGPRVLEHIVDTVLDFEGDRHHGFRILRSSKNRFGSTDDVALFQMKETGLEEVPNPSQAFLEERMRKVPGSVIVSALEGTRPFLIEIQSLVSSSSYATPTRRSVGFDQNRLSLLLAVLEKRVGYRLYTSDVFVSVVGGMRLLEPALDLGVLLAIASSFSGKAIDSETIVLGEVGLGGEIRAVSRIESRLKEAMQMGFKRAVIPKRNLKGLSQELQGKLEIIGVSLVEDAIHGLIS